MSYTTNRIRDTLAIVPFTLRNERVQRFEYFLLTELGDELFYLTLDLTRNGRSQFGRDI